MSIQQDETAVISFPIKLVSEEGLDTGGDGETEEDSEALEALEDFIKTTDKQGLQTLSKFAKNPEGAVQGQLLGILGKAGVHGAIAVGLIALIVGTPELITQIVKQLSVKGGALNQDFHRFFEDEAQVGLSRELQYRRAVGLDVVITTNTKGFLLTDPAFVDNSLIDVDTTRSLRLSSNETAYGYVNGM